jgi:hypothetical protein
MKVQIRPSAKKAGSKSPTSASRKQLESAGEAMPGGRYPIPNVDFLKRAVRSIGRTPPGKRAAVVSWIKKRASALGQPKLAANLSNAADYALNLANQKDADAIELAGAPGGSGDTLPQGGTKKETVDFKNLKTKDFQSKVKKTALKTKSGKMNYAKLRAQGYDKKTSKAAALKHEQGLINSEMSNPQGALNLANFDTDDVQGKLGLKSPGSLKVYAKARKKGLPHNVALQAAKHTDKKAKDSGMANANAPKA